jgi:ankyrin repeat protein
MNKPKFTSDDISNIRLLLDHGTNPNRVNEPFHNGPGFNLYNAIRYASLEVVELLLRHGSIVEQSSAVHAAAGPGRIDFMSLLLEHGADVNEKLCKNNRGNSVKLQTKMTKEFGITHETHGRTKRRCTSVCYANRSTLQFGW